MTIEKKINNFILKAKKAHPNENLDYSKVVYINSKTPVEIIDHDLKPDGSEYGTYWQTPENHTRGQGHPDKRGKKISKSRSSNQNEIIERFKKVHKGENLDYSQVEYVNMHTKVKIISHDLRPDGTEYGVFWQEPWAHLKGCTHPELKKRGRNKMFVNTCVNPNSAKDFLKIFSETQNDENIVVCGKYGFNYIPITEYDKYQIENKTKKYKQDGITLINIFEDEFIEHKEIVIDKIRHIIGQHTRLNRVFGRKCEIKKIEKKEMQNFLNEYHIQGCAGCTIAYGAFYNGELVAVMTFLLNGVWELNRFCTKRNYLCPGVASKLFTHFVREKNPVFVKSFLDKRWCFNEEDNLYTKLGFHKDGVLGPEYRYSNGDGKRHHKFSFRKNFLHRKYGLSLEMTETQMTKKLGYYKVWDCGLIRYVWKKEREE